MEGVGESLVDLLYAGLVNSVTDNYDILTIDSDHALSLMHTQLDVFITLLIATYPQANEIRYVLTFDGEEILFNPCNDFTQGLTVNMKKVY